MHREVTAFTHCPHHPHKRTTRPAYILTVVTHDSALLQVLVVPLSLSYKKEDTQIWAYLRGKEALAFLSPSTQLGFNSINLRSTYLFRCRGLAYLSMTQEERRPASLSCEVREVPGLSREITTDLFTFQKPVKKVRP